MPLTPMGRHCGLCAKDVVDLTHLTGDQLLAILKKSGGTFCGRVTDAQLNRPLVSCTETTLSARLVVHHSSYGRLQVPLGAGPYPEVIELPPPPPVKAISGGGLVVVKRKWWQRRRQKECSE